MAGIPSDQQLAKTRSPLRFGGGPGLARQMWQPPAGAAHASGSPNSSIRCRIVFRCMRANAGSFFRRFRISASISRSRWRSKGAITWAVVAPAGTQPTNRQPNRCRVEKLSASKSPTQYSATEHIRHLETKLGMRIYLDPRKQENK